MAFATIEGSLRVGRSGEACIRGEKDIARENSRVETHSVLKRGCGAEAGSIEKGLSMAHLDAAGYKKEH